MGAIENDIMRGFPIPGATREYKRPDRTSVELTTEGERRLGEVFLIPMLRIRGGTGVTDQRLRGNIVITALESEIAYAVKELEQRGFRGDLIQPPPLPVEQ